jgi:hypothetical protein
VSVTVEELAARLGLEVDESAFAAAHQMIKGLETGLLGLGAALVAYVGGIQLAMRGTREQALQARWAAQMTGVSTDAIQELHFAAEAAGGSAEGLDHMLIRLSRSAFAASQGSKEAQSTFHQLGISAFDSSGKLKTSDVLLGDLAEKFSKMPDGMEKTALAMRVFGRSGAEAIPMLNKGRAGIAELREEAHAYGYVLDKETIEQSRQWARADYKLQASLTGLRNEIAGPLIAGAGKLALWAAEWVRLNRPMIAGIIRKPYELLRDVIKSLAENTWILKVALASITGYLLTTHVPAIVTAIGWYIGLGIASAGAAVKAALAWAAAAIPVLAMTAMVGFLLLLAMDIWGYLHDEQSMVGDIGKGIDEWEAKIGKSKKEFGGIRDFFLTMVWTVTHIGETIEEWGKTLGRLPRWVAEMAWGPVPTSGAPTPAAGAVSGGRAAFAGYPAPTMAAPAAGARSVRSSLSVGTITYSAPPGASTKEHVAAMIEGLEDWWDSKMQEAVPATRTNYVETTP